MAMKNASIALLLAASLFITPTPVLNGIRSGPPRSQKTPKALYLRIAAVYAGKIPKGYDLPESLLRKYGHTFEGRMMLLGHDWGDPLKAVGVIQETKVKDDEEHRKAYLEMLVKITDPDAIQRIQRGTFKFVSVGFTSRRMVCSIDGNENCFFHRPGQRYEVERKMKVPVLFPLPPLVANMTTKEICFFQPIEMIGQELSFVNVPAVRWARVLEVSKEPLVI